MQDGGFTDQAAEAVDDEDDGLLRDQNSSQQVFSLFSAIKLLRERPMLQCSELSSTLQSFFVVKSGSLSGSIRHPPNVPNILLYWDSSIK